MWGQRGNQWARAERGEGRQEGRAWEKGQEGKGGRGQGEEGRESVLYQSISSC